MRGCAVTEGRGLTGYSVDHALAGLDAELPAIATWANPYKQRGFQVEIESREFTSVCPKTGLPDFGTVRLVYQPAERCVELKSFKLYLLEYRNLPIFQENAVNRILEDIVEAAQPTSARVEGHFNARGGLTTSVTARHPAPSA